MKKIILSLAAILGICATSLSLTSCKENSVVIKGAGGEEITVKKSNDEELVSKAFAAYANKAFESQKNIYSVGIHTESETEQEYKVNYLSENTKTTINGDVRLTIGKNKYTNFKEKDIATEEDFSKAKEELKSNVDLEVQLSENVQSKSTINRDEFIQYCSSLGVDYNNIPNISTETNNNINMDIKGFLESGNLYLELEGTKNNPDEPNFSNNYVSTNFFEGLPCTYITSILNEYQSSNFYTLLSKYTNLELSEYTTENFYESDYYNYLKKFVSDNDVEITSISNDDVTFKINFNTNFYNEITKAMSDIPNFTGIADIYTTPNLKDKKLGEYNIVFSNEGLIKSEDCNLEIDMNDILDDDTNTTKFKINLKNVITYNDDVKFTLSKDSKKEYKEADLNTILEESVHWII